MLSTSATSTLVPQYVTNVRRLSRWPTSPDPRGTRCRWVSSSVRSARLPAWCGPRSRGARRRSRSGSRSPALRSLRRETVCGPPRSTVGAQRQQASLGGRPSAKSAGHPPKTRGIVAVVVVISGMPPRGNRCRVPQHPKKVSASELQPCRRHRPRR